MELLYFCQIGIRTELNVMQLALGMRHVVTDIWASCNNTKSKLIALHDAIKSMRGKRCMPDVKVDVKCVPQRGMVQGHVM